MAMPNAPAVLVARLSSADMDLLILNPNANEALAGVDVLALATKGRNSAIRILLSWRGSCALRQGAMGAAVPPGDHAVAWVRGLWGRGEGHDEIHNKTT